MGNALFRMRSLLSALCIGLVHAGTGFVSFPLHHERSSPRLWKRQANTAGGIAQSIELGDGGSLYWMNMTLGTPPQSVRLQLDTGSSNIVVPSNEAVQCSNSSLCPGGFFTPSNSSTYRVLSANTFNNTYADRTAYLGDYITDIIGVGDVQLPEGLVPIGLANELVDGPQTPNDGTGLVGVSYQIIADQLHILSNGSTNTIVSAMVSNGNINRQAYSLSLGTWETGRGTVIFGGVDSSLFSDDLVAVPMLPEIGTEIHATLQIPLAAVSVFDANENIIPLSDPGFVTPAIIDSGTTAAYFPAAIFRGLVAGFGAATVDGDLLVPCSRGHNTSISFQFAGSNGPILSVPFPALLIDPATLGSPRSYATGEAACLLNIMPENGNGLILGDVIMRSGYFVFDLDNNIAAVANASSTGESGDTSNIRAIPSGTEIPLASSTASFTGSATTNQVETFPTTDTGSLDAPASPTFDVGPSATTSIAGPGGGFGPASGSGTGGGSPATSTSASAAAQSVVPGRSYWIWTAIACLLLVMAT